MEKLEETVRPLALSMAELSSLPSRVNCLGPGSVDTKMLLFPLVLEAIARGPFPHNPKSKGRVAFEPLG